MLRVEEVQGVIHSFNFWLGVGYNVTIFAYNKAGYNQPRAALSLVPLQKPEERKPVLLISANISR